MQYKKWDEWDSEHEQFIVLSYYGQTDFVFSIRKLPDFRYDEANSIHEEYLKRLKRAYRKYLNKDGYDGYSHDIKMVWKIGLTDTEIESLLQDRRPVKQWLQNVALQVKEELESIVRFKAERIAELDDDSDSNDTDSANGERPDNIPSFPIDSFSPVVPDGSVPVPFVASRKDTVSSCTSEVKQPDDESTRHLRNIDKEQKQQTKQQLSIITVLQDGFVKVIERQDKMLELQEQHATLKDAEQTPPPSPEPEETDNQIDWDALEKELASVKGSEVNDKGYLGKQRLIMRENYGFSVRQIWEYENPGSIWKQLSPYERKSASNSINESIKNARKKQSEK